MKFLIDLLSVVTASYICWAILGALVGFVGVLSFADGSNDLCKYKNIASRSNIGYIVICEAFRPRYADVCDPIIKDRECN